MCLCNPNIKSPWCPQCNVLISGVEHNHMEPEVANETFEKVRMIIMNMNGLSDTGFINKYLNDPMFHKGVDALVVSIAKGREK